MPPHHPQYNNPVANVFADLMIARTSYSVMPYRVIIPQKAI